MWKEPEGGPHQVAIRSQHYEARADEIENFFGKPLRKYSHAFVHDRQSYVVFTFKHEAEAQRFMKAFDGEPFDPRDSGRGSNWMKWYKGRAAKRARNRSPYDF